MAKSSTPPVSSPATSSRLAKRLKEAKEHATLSPGQQSATRRSEVPPPATTSTQSAPRSLTKSIRSSIVKSLTFRPSKRKSEEEKWPKIELYKAHEVPRPKYRGPVDRKHMAVLAAYSIVKATKQHNRRSIDSAISPLATRAPSRGESVDSHSIAATTIVRRPGDVVDDRHDMDSPKYESSQDEDSNATSILSSDEGANISSSTLLTSHTTEEELQHHPRWQETRLKRTTAFTATDLLHALNAIDA
ncbi:hypothetical protein FQN49_008096 [Arthroderma sp. PD_2]|nr:hypothetical protein FQN49_008096 [Arthroderma sp. PD_2]